MEADDAIVGLVTECGDRLLRLAYQLTHDRAAAEDVVQEALTRMYQTWRRRMPDLDDPYAYARRSVTNEFLRRARRRASSEIVTDALPEQPVDAADDDVADRDALWPHLAALPERQRAVLVLRYYDDLPDRQIADLLDAKEATVRSLARRGLQALRDADQITRSAT